MGGIPRNKFRTSTRIIAAAGATLLVMAGSCSAIGMPPDRKGIESFEAAWEIVDSNYYDRTFNGLHWRSVRDRYYQKALRADTSFELYWGVINPMLSLLESSHVTATPPRIQMNVSGEDAAMAVMEPVLGRCTGMLLAWGRRPVSSVVKSLSPSSQLFRQGLRIGWKIEFISLGENEDRKSILLHTRGPDGQAEIFRVDDFPSGPHLLEQDVLEGDIYNDVLQINEINSETLTAYNALKAGDADPDRSVLFDELQMVASLGRHPNPPRVLRVRPGSIADRAGVSPGWTIHDMKSSALDDHSITSLTLEDSQGQMHEAAMTYACPSSARQLPDMDSTLLENDILVLRFDKFSAESAYWVKDNLEKLQPSGLILDLRENVGGSVAAMQNILGLILPSDSIIGYSGTRDIVSPLRVDGATRVYRGKVAVLVSPVTASAAEATAAALRHHGRASIFGARTAGEVVASNTYPLPDGGTIQVATSDFLDPSHTRLEGVGVVPDVEVWDTPESVRLARDPVLETALAAF